MDSYHPLVSPEDRKLGDVLNRAGWAVWYVICLTQGVLVWKPVGLAFFTLMAAIMLIGVFAALIIERIPTPKNGFVGLLPSRLRIYLRGDDVLIKTQKGYYL